MTRVPPSRRVLAAALTCLILAAAAAADTSSENLRRFDQVWRTVREKFYDPNLHGLDWQAIGRKYRSRAESDATRADLQQTLNDMLAELHASHVHYATADDFDYWLLRSVFMPDERPTKVPHIGVQGVQENGAFVVHAMLEGGPAASAGIRYGDRLISADGKPFTTVGSFRNRERETVRLTLERSRAGRIEMSLVPVVQTPIEAYAQAVRQSAHVIERDGKRLGYVHLWCMFHRDVLRAFDEALEKLANTDGLILDLRDGYGGSPDRFDYSLFRPDVTMTTIPRGGSASVEHNGYGKPLVVLINEGSRSAKEYFAYELKKSRRGTLVGAKTMGAFLGAGGFAIADDGLLMLPVLDLRVDGKRLEGVGVSPDVEVKTENAYSVDDRQIARAEEVLLAKIRAANREVAARALEITTSSRAR